MDYVIFFGGVVVGIVAIIIVLAWLFRDFRVWPL
jgi:hypothetical protein